MKKSNFQAPQNHEKMCALIGHTMMGCDRGHGAIALAKKKFKRCIYDIDDFIALCNSVPNVDAFKLDIKKIPSFQNTNSCTISPQFKHDVSKAKSILIEKQDFNGDNELKAHIYYKLDYRDTHFTRVWPVKSRVKTFLFICYTSVVLALLRA